MIVDQLPEPASIAFRLPIQPCVVHDLVALKIFGFEPKEAASY